MSAFLRPALAALILMALPLAAPGQAPSPATVPASAPSGEITSGWVLLKEGSAEGTIEADARHPANPDPHLLRIAVSKYAREPGDGRVGAKNTASLAVTEGQDYDLTFTGISEGIGVGLVVSLENDQGKVLARTTLPEIGRGAGGRRGAAPSAAPWQKYLVSLHVRSTDPAAHLVITPIEPVAAWLDHVVLAPRSK